MGWNETTAHHLAPAKRSSENKSAWKSKGLWEWEREKEGWGEGGGVKLDRGSRGYGFAAGRARAISMGIELQDGGGRSYIFSDKQKGFDRLGFHLAEMIARCIDMHRFIMYLGERRAMLAYQCKLCSFTVSLCYSKRHLKSNEARRSSHFPEQLYLFQIL